MGTYPVPVDVEQLVIAYLLANPDAQAVFEGRIGSRIPDEPDVYPLTTVHRFGGVHGRQGWRDRARIQFDVWGSSKKQARDGSAALYTVMLDLPGVHDLGVITGVEDLMGLTWAPDPATDRPRYVFQQIVSCHPNP